MRQREPLVTANDFAEAMGWKYATPYRKLYTSRRKMAAGKPLTARDIPLPDVDEERAPRWHLSTLERFRETYPKRSQETVNPPTGNAE